MDAAQETRTREQVSRNRVEALRDGIVLFLMALAFGLPRDARACH